MLIRSISINATYTLRIKRVFSLDILVQLVHLWDTLPNGIMHKAICLVVFFTVIIIGSLLKIP